MFTDMITSNDELLRQHAAMDVRSYRRMLLGLNRHHADHPSFGSCKTEEEAQAYVRGLIAWLRRLERERQERQEQA